MLNSVTQQMKGTKWGLHLQVVHVTGVAGATAGPVHFLDLSAGPSFLRLGVTEPLLAFCLRKRAGLRGWLVCRGAAVELGLWGRRLNFFHRQLPLGLLGNVGCFGTVSGSLCEKELNVFEWPLDEDVVKLHFASSNGNAKSYWVAEPELMSFFRRNTVSIHPHTVQALRKKTTQCLLE